MGVYYTLSPSDYSDLIPLSYAQLLAVGAEGEPIVTASAIYTPGASLALNFQPGAILSTDFSPGAETAVATGPGATIADSYGVGAVLTVIV